MPERSLAIASSTSLFSLSMLSNCWLRPVEVLVGLQIDAAQPLTVGLEAGELAVGLPPASAAAAAGASSASARQSSGAQPSCSRILRASSARRSRAFSSRASVRARALALIGDGGLRRAQLPAPPPVGVVGGRERVGSGAPVTIGRGQLAHQLLALLLDHVRYVGQLRDLGLRGPGVRSSSVRDLLLGAGDARTSSARLPPRWPSAARPGRDARARA